MIGIIANIFVLDNALSSVNVYLIKPTLHVLVLPSLYEKRNLTPNSYCYSVEELGLTGIVSRTTK